MHKLDDIAILVNKKYVLRTKDNLNAVKTMK